MNTDKQTVHTAGLSTGEPADQKRSAFEELCEALPDGVNWGDAITPAIAGAIWQAALASQLKQPTMQDGDTAMLTYKLVASTGYECEGEASGISPEHWGHICAAIAGQERQPAAQGLPFIPVTANFASAPEWEKAIDAGIRVWLRWPGISTGDRRAVIAMFNAMLAEAPKQEGGAA
ncbi:hypothetical protein [Chromobacterium rhizoryzae]|uniref:hypothetical protein n=1 Tax=Chromobacterium rhizoryzae TaxID=1778675 RepID=UPI001D085E12|nr:hypothetical protein [Chromobacterium rhizoryzae]